MKRWWTAALIWLSVLGGCTEQKSASLPQSPPPAVEIPTPAPAQIASPVPAADPTPSFFRPVQNLPVAEVTNETYFVALDSIDLIQCDNSLGTGSIISTNTIITASHVVGQASVCYILRDGVKIETKIVFNSPELDYAVLEAPTGRARRFPIDCDGFIPGQQYVAIGNAHGRDFAITKLVATEEFRDAHDYNSGQDFKHSRVLLGRTYQGMSGGPILNMDGEQVGTVIAGPTDGSARTLSRELRDTYVCDEERQASETRRRRR